MEAQSIYLELEDRLTATLMSLPDKPEETIGSTLHALWHLAAGSQYSAARATLHPLPDLDREQEQALRTLVQRRIDGVPLSHLTQRQCFMGIEMIAGVQALVPRAETELLARRGIEIAQALSAEGGPVTVIDVCTGSGNVALAIAHHVPQARVHAADLSGDAVEFARSNARYLGLEGRVEFRAGDLLSPFDNPEFARKVDIITCNPPYISSAKVSQMPREISEHEPSLAFDGGPFGVSILMRLLDDAPRLLRPGGWLAFEVGLGQGASLARRLQASAYYCDVRSHADAAGTIRALSARRVDQP